MPDVFTAEQDRSGRGDPKGSKGLQKPERLLSGRKLRMLLSCAGATFLIMLDSNIVAVSLPSIARDLHGEFTDVEWVVSSYILAFAAILIPAGAIADRLGRRRTLMAGLSIFTLASLLCGLAPSLAVLNGARALQGFGAAFMLSSALAVIANGIKPQERVAVYAFWGTIMGLAPSLGPVVGGLVTSYVGWRWAFLVNLPIGFGLIALGLASITESRDPKADRLDFPGIVLFGSGLFSIVWALIAANNVGWESPSTLMKLAAGALLLVAFVFAERLHPRAMIDLVLFRDRNFLGATIAQLGYASAAQVMMTLLPLYLQDAFGQSPARAGIGMIPFALPMLIGPTIGRKLAARVSSRAILSFGLWLVALGDLLTAGVVSAGFPYWAAAVCMVFTGAGAGVLNSETAKAQMGAVPAERAGMASGWAGATRFVGIILGLAGLGAVLAGLAESGLRQKGTLLVGAETVDWHALSLRIVGGDPAGGLSVLPVQTQAAIQTAVHTSVANGFSAAFFAAAAIAALASVAVWILLGNNEGPGTLNVATIADITQS
jgi:EmrB/QacA subfamily drug resistance transporter